MQQTIKHRLKLKKLIHQSYIGKDVLIDGRQGKVTGMDGDEFVVDLGRLRSARIKKADIESALVKSGKSK